MSKDIKLKEFFCTSCGKAFFLFGRGSTKYCSDLCRAQGPRSAWESRGKLQKKIDVERKDRKGKGRKRRVMCIETGEIYNSMVEAQKITGVNKNTISRCCSGFLKSAGGYHWELVD